MSPFHLSAKPVAALVALTSITIHTAVDKHGEDPSAQVAPPVASTVGFPASGTGSSTSAEWHLLPPDPTEQRLGWNIDAPFWLRHPDIGYRDRSHSFYPTRVDHIGLNWRRSRIVCSDGQEDAWRPWMRLHVDLEGWLGECEQDTALPEPEPAYCERVLTHLRKSLRLPERPAATDVRSYGIRGVCNGPQPARLVPSETGWRWRFPDEKVINWDSTEQVLWRQKLQDLVRVVDSLMLEQRRRDARTRNEPSRSNTMNNS